METSPEREITKPGDRDFAAQLTELRARLDEIGETPHGEGVAVLMQDLETAHEELRVADEEVRSQQEQIRLLLEGQQLLRWQQERMLGAMPIPVITTDSRGVVRSVNAAAAILFRTRVSRMLGKPVFSFFAVEDRAELRRSMAAHARAGGDFNTSARVGTHAEEQVAVEIFTTAGYGGAEETAWLLLTGDGDRPSRPTSDGLPQALVALAALSVSAENVQDILRHAAEICADALGDEIELSINLGDPAAPEAVATSSKAAQEFDGVQVRLGEGPCVDAFTASEVVIAEDLHADRRWPRLAKESPEEIRSTVSVPMEVGEHLIGALNIYLGPARSASEIVHPGELLAATIGAVLHEAELKAELEALAGDMRAALTSRSTIDQAKGIVMADRGGTPDEAFAYLARLSSEHNVKLREVATMLVERAAQARGAGGA